MNATIKITSLGYGFFCYIKFDKTIMEVDFSINDDETLDFSICNYVVKENSVSITQVKEFILENLSDFKDFREKYNDFDFVGSENSLEESEYVSFLHTKLKWTHVY